MIVLAILLPWLSFLLRGKLFSGILCIILQLTCIGWIPAAIWAVISLNNAKAEERTNRMIAAMKAASSRHH